MAPTKASQGESLESYVNGYTGKVISLTENGGQMALKTVQVMFTRDVVFLSDCDQPPRNLLDCLAVGDSLHYNAILTKSPRPPHTLMYLATKVWQPNVKSKGTSSASSTTSSATAHGSTASGGISMSAATINAKLVVKIIKALLQKNGPLHVVVLLAYFDNASVEIRNIFGNSVTGLRKFITDRPQKFVLNDDTVSVYEKSAKAKKQATSGEQAQGKPKKANGELEKKSVNTIKNLLKPFGSMPVAQLFALTSNCNADVRNFIGLTEKNFHHFLTTHKDVFSMLPYARVTIREEANKTKAAAPNQRAASGKSVSTPQQETAVVSYYKTLVDTCGPISIEGVLAMLNNGLQPEICEVVGTTSKAVQDFFRRHPDTFHLQPNGMVFLTSASSKDSSVPVEDQRDLVVKSIDFLKNILDVKGPLLVNKLVGHLASSPEIRKFIGGSPNMLTAFLKNHTDVFVISRSNVVHRADRMEQVVDGGTQDKGMQMPVYHRGIVLLVNSKFSFIQHGTVDYENVFFDVTAYMQWEKGSTNIGDLQTVFTVGDMVDCLFVESSKEKKCKYRAIAVWKITSGDEIDAPVISLVSTLSSPVLYGEVRVTFLEASVGYCVVEDSGSESLMEFEGKFKMKPTLIVFHMKHVSYPKELSNHLKMGSRVKLIACSKSIRKDSSVECWNAVSMWPSSGLQSRIDDGPGMHWVTANIREMTNEGGELSFGSDSWKHRISFNWEYLLANSVFNKVVNVRVGDMYWCIVKNRGTMGDTKWVAIKMRPCNDDDDDPSSPPDDFNTFLHISVLDTLMGGDQRLEGNVSMPKTSSKSSSVLPISSSTTVSGQLCRSLDPTTKEDEFESETSQLLHQLDSESVSTTFSCSENDEFLLSLLDSKSGVLAPQTSAAKPSARQEISLLDYMPLFETKGSHETTAPVIHGTGSIVSMDPYGGLLETENKEVVYFGAHSFYLNGKPVTHYLFTVNTVVHFDARRGGSDDSLVAVKVWIGKKPE